MTEITADVLEAPSAGEAAAEEERRTSYLELFFDLVFVFAITQVTTLVLGDLSATGFARGALVLALIWWAWSGFTWMTNAVDIASLVTRLLFLAGMAGAFLAALSVPGAYTDQSAWFAVAYAAIRVLNLALYAWGLRDRPAQLRALLQLAPFFLAAPALVLVGGTLVEGPWRTALWALSITIDLVGVLAAGTENEWRVSPGHFAERYALIVIIALGESIVAIGVAVAALERDDVFVLSVVVAFVGVAALWSTYFGYVSSAAERALRKATESRRGPLARDVFTILHYPLVLGIIFFAVASKKVLTHPDEPLSRAGRWALGLGLGLFLLGFVLMRLRVVRSVGWERVGGIAAIVVAIVVLRDADAVVTFAVCVGVLLVVLAIETVTLRHIRAALQSS
jgi:low temperature requirement protein LtrA